MDSKCQYDFLGNLIYLTNIMVNDILWRTNDNRISYNEAIMPLIKYYIKLLSGALYIYSNKSFFLKHSYFLWSFNINVRFKYYRAH